VQTRLWFYGITMASLVVHRFCMQLVSVASHREDRAYRLHVLSIIFFVVVSHFL
jgi:hypothetical protein